jgi:HSP20 family protein
VKIVTRLTIRDPFRGLFAWPRWTDDFEDSFTTQRGLKIHETKNNILAEAVVAGVPAEDIEIHVEGGVLTIKAEKTEEEKKKGQYKTSSYQYYYTAALSGGQWDKAKAVTENGVVKITIPKAKVAKRRQIAVKSRSTKSKK